MVAGHRQHIADAAGLQLGPQPGVGAVDLVAGHPRRRDRGVQRAADHGRGQLGLGRKPDLVGDAGRPQARRIINPALGQVQLPVDHGMAGAAGIHHVDGDLGVLDPAGGAGVLALHPNGRRPLLEVPGLVDHQDRLGVAQVLDHQGAHVVADRVVVPHRPGQQVLHPVRVGSPVCSAIVQQFLRGRSASNPSTNAPGPPPQLHPSKPARDPAHHLVEQLLPPGRFHGYAVARGHRLSFGRAHNTGSSTVAALVCSPPLTNHVTISGWSTSATLPRLVGRRRKHP
jgi:hypothetical protein